MADFLNLQGKRALITAGTKGAALQLSACFGSWVCTC
jgi:hypothetical protein